MTTTTYQAAIYADLTKASVLLLNTLAPAEISRVTKFLKTYLFAGGSGGPAGAPWSGTIALDPVSKVPVLPVVHALVDVLIDDWNTKYTMQLQGGSTGPEETDQALGETWRWRWENGALVWVPNYTLTRQGESTPFDPYAAMPANPGLSGRLRLEVQIAQPAE
jgi:hypothetical protein